MKHTGTRTPAKSKAINEKITLRELLRKFEAHKRGGGSALTFPAEMGIGRRLLRTWLARFPTFAAAYNEARLEERARSPYGNILGTRRAQYVNRDYEVQLPTLAVSIYRVNAHCKEEALLKARRGQGELVGAARGRKIVIKRVKGDL